MFLIDDKESDLRATKVVGLAWHLFTDGNLESFVDAVLGKSLDG